MKRNWITLRLFTISAAMMLSFQNCSPVNFATATDDPSAGLGDVSTSWPGVEIPNDGSTTDEISDGDGGTVPSNPPVVVTPPTNPPVVVSPPVTNPPVVVSPPVTNPPVVVSPPVTNPPVVVAPPTNPPVVVAPPTNPPVVVSPPVTNPPVVVAPPVTNPPVVVSPPTNPPVSVTPGDAYRAACAAKRYSVSNTLELGAGASIRNTSSSGNFRAPSLNVIEHSSGRLTVVHDGTGSGKIASINNASSETLICGFDVGTISNISARIVIVGGSVGDISSRSGTLTLVGSRITGSSTNSSGSFKVERLD